MRPVDVARHVILAAAVACCNGASNDPAADALLRVPNAQYVDGPTPTGALGPEVLTLELLTNTIWPGDPDKPIRGTLAESATAVTLALSGDRGYWIVRAGVPDVAAPDLPTFRAFAAFSASLPPDAYTLEARAVDAAGRFGPPTRQTLTALAEPPPEKVEGALVVALDWDTEVDLDLHVVDPLGNEIFHGAPSSRDAFAPGAKDESVGTLDRDSNAGCVIDGFRREHVVWAAEPPSGHYRVRVDTASLCGEPTAHWTVEARLDGVRRGSASGLSLESDTRDPHDRGAGVLALELDVP